MHPDVALEPEYPSERHQQRDHHRQPREDGSGHEVGREDRAVPARQDRHREVPGHHAVDRHDERGRQGGKESVQRHVVPPLPVGPEPAQRQHAVDLPAPVRDPVPRRGDVRHQPEIQEHHAHGQIRGDGEDIPDQRRAEVHPELTRVRVGNQPVEEPRAPEVDDRKQRGGHDGEHGHRLGRAGYRRPPFGPEQKQDRRDQRTGVRDADPEDEVGDVDGPEDRVLVAGDTHAGPGLIQKRQHADRQGGERQRQPDVVDRAGWPERAQDVVVDRREAHRSCVTFFRYVTAGRVFNPFST